MSRSFEERQVLAAAAAIRAKDRKAAKALRPAKVIPTAKGQRQPRDKDSGFLSWLHDSIPCIACLIDGRSPNPHHIEAAHQKLAIAAAGWKEGGGGVRTHDHRCVPLCRWHHQDAPNACDKGQRKFWDRLGLGDGVATLCGDLYAAFKGGSSGRAVVIGFANLARSQRSIIERTKP